VFFVGGVCYPWGGGVSLRFGDRDPGSGVSGLSAGFGCGDHRGWCSLGLGLAAGAQDVCS
jgi:hypothetical protein